MAVPTTFRGIIDLWPSRAAMKEDCERYRKRAVAQPRLWHSRDSIPVRWFEAVERAAKYRGFKGVDYALLSDIARGRIVPEAI